jgi:hypothetical protein
MYPPSESAQVKQKIRAMRNTITHRSVRDVAPVVPRELHQLRADSNDLFDALTPPDLLRKVGSMMEELARLKKMQRSRV